MDSYKFVLKWEFLELGKYIYVLDNVIIDFFRNN